jgi:DNA-binding GntR family transcriptional regulator
LLSSVSHNIPEEAAGLALMNVMNAETTISRKIVELIKEEGWDVGTHLPAQLLADRLRVSRQPINAALAFLHEKQYLNRERNRGYFVAKPIVEPLSDIVNSLGLAESDAVSSAYFRIADDLLKQELPQECSELLLRNRYGLTTTQLNAVLGRIAQEGWVERKPGYGWVFSSMLSTPDSLLQSYRLRLALEPAALLEPGYRLDRKVLEQCRATELYLLDGHIMSASADELHNRGVRFHESLVEASGNAFFIDTIKRVNRVRRLLSYRSMQQRERYPEHCRQHLHLLELLEREKNEEASAFMREHLLHTLNSLSKIENILQPAGKQTHPEQSLPL